MDPQGTCGCGKGVSSTLPPRTEIITFTRTPPQFEPSLSALPRLGLEHNESKDLLVFNCDANYGTVDKGAQCQMHRRGMGACVWTAPAS